MKMSRIESGVRNILAFNEAFNRHDVTGMMQFVSDTCVFESSAPAPDGAVYTGKAAITQFWQDFFRRSPQAHRQIEDIFGLGLRCVTRWRYEWVDESGKKKYIRGTDTFKFKENAIIEQFSYVKGTSGV
jgi:predicted SnoaL-like aldol condensation-catalyzing enzyme